LVKNRDFLIPLAFDAPVREVPVGVLPSRLVWKKLEWSGYSMVKKLVIGLAVSTEYRRVTDRRTDRQTDGQTYCHGIDRYGYASPGKNGAGHCKLLPSLIHR